MVSPVLLGAAGAGGVQSLGLRKPPGPLYMGCSCAGKQQIQTADSSGPAKAARFPAKAELYSRRACFSEVLAKVWDSGGSETQGNSLKGAFRFLSVTLAESTSLPLRRENLWAPRSAAATPSDAASARGPGQRPLPTAAALVIA